MRLLDCTKSSAGSDSLRACICSQCREERSLARPYVALVVIVVRSEDQPQDLDAPREYPPPRFVVEGFHDAEEARRAWDATSAVHPDSYLLHVVKAPRGDMTKIPRGTL